MFSSNLQTLCLIVPCYNEAANISLFINEANKHLKNIDWHICFINDGSSDNSWDIIQEESVKNPRIHGLNFVRNFGHQNAIKAGINEAPQFIEANAYVILDADLQHPIEYIPDMLVAWKEGYHIVQMKRKDEDRDISLFKKMTSKAFYSIFSQLSGIKMESGLSDFRLIDKNVIQFIKTCNEKDLFLRGLLSWSGFRTKIIPYQPKERIYGESKFTLKKMTKLAMSGIIGYSTRPLHISLFIGLLCILFAIIYFFYIMLNVIIGSPNIIMGWPSILASLLLMGGVQLVIIGVLGIYLGRLFMEIKHRPSYIIESHTR